VKRWVDLNDLRRDIAAEAKARALVAGLEGVKVHVRIAEPDRRGARVIDVEVTHATTALAVSTRRPS
jgi:hypothetical protein